MTERGEPTPFRRIHHVALIVSDYDRSKEFYVGVLGYRIVRETHRAERASHKLDLTSDGGDTLELFSFPDPPPRPSYPEATGLRHLAFAVDDLGRAVAYLAERGITAEPVRVDATTGQRYTFFADPDDLPLELYEVC